MNRLFTYFKHPIPKHLLFWLVVYLYFVLSVNNMGMYAGYRHLFESYGAIVLAQIVTAYTCLYLLVPKFLNTKKICAFIFWLLILLLAINAIYQAFRMYYFDVVYFDSYNEIQRRYALESYSKRLSYFSVFLSKTILYLTPTVLLLMARFYQNQQKYLKLNEQKKSAELTALRNQLNPHFLFNTLNNLYSLALEKSEKTPEVIGRLSDILDYILYRCKDKYTSLNKEIELIKNYLALEKIRYGKRVEISFRKEVGSDTKIAPLILLTFIENAFKHGVKEELKQAQITIELISEKNLITFKITNSKPEVKIESDTEKLGLKNVKKQLNLLYSKTHSLQILDTQKTYSIILKLQQQNV